MLKRTPLYDIHKKLGARMVEFGGWEMPIQYTGVIDEHQTVRQSVGLFDISHMGEILVMGTQASAFVNYLTTNDITRIQDYGCQYSALCYENGMVVDDVISYRFNANKYLVVVNASNTLKDFEWFACHREKHPWLSDVKIENVSPLYCQLALQGPKAHEVLEPLVCFSLSQLSTYTFCETTLFGKSIILSRTGYTGEDGFEIYGKWDNASWLWEKILKAGEGQGIKPIGLGARDTLRLEASYSLYGHEIGESINPFEARLGWIVKLDKLDKSEFIGKKELLEIKAKGPKRNLIGLMMVDREIPRQGFKVYLSDRCVGHVTSGTYSPTLKKGIALALIESSFGKNFEDFFIEIRNEKKKAKKASLPFYAPLKEK